MIEELSFEGGPRTGFTVPLGRDERDRPSAAGSWTS